MDAYTETLSRLIAELGRLPGIGRRTAERLAFHLLGAEKGEAKALAAAITDLKARLTPCPECGGLAEDGAPCPVCSNPRRDRSRLCVVETARDIVRLEAAGGYNGLYHVLGGLLAPMDGHGPESLDLAGLVDRAADPGVEEVILALSPTAEGDGTALYVVQRLKGRRSDLKVTRLARGLPAGAGLEYANQGTLSEALRGREELGT